MKLFVRTIYLTIAITGTIAAQQPVKMPAPEPTVKMYRPLPIQVWGIPDTAGLVIHPTQVQDVKLPDWNGTAKMFTPVAQVVFMDIPIEVIARHEGYERVGYKLYRRLSK